MKSIKKTFSVVLCLVTASAMLAACSNGGNDDAVTNSSTDAKKEQTTAFDQPSAEADTLQSVTEEQTETTESQKDEEGIIPLFPAEINGQVHTLTPEELLVNSKYISLFKAYDSGKTIDTVTAELGDTKIPLFTTEFLDRSFEISAQEQNGKSITLTALYFEGAIKGLQDDENLVIAGFRSETENGEKANILGFLPLYYNQTKKCLFGYGKKAGQYILCEMYYSGTEEIGFSRQAAEDASIYGF